MASGVTLKGDWRKLRHRFNKMSTYGQRGARSEIYQLAHMVRDELHEVVNSCPPPENAETTIRRKGFDAPLMEEGGMMEDDSIVVKREHDSKNRITYIVKGNPDKTHPRSGATYEEIVQIAEEGGDKIPPRQVLSMTYDRLKDDIERSVIKHLNEELFSD